MGNAVVQGLAGIVPSPPRVGASVMVALAGLLLAMNLGLGSARPVGAASAQQYHGGATSISPCFAPLRDPRATCPWAWSQLPGGFLDPETDRRAMSIIGAMNNGGGALIEMADSLADSQVNGAWWNRETVVLRGVTLRDPWKAASLQGLAISTLSRAHAIEPSARYLAAIEAAVSAMPIDSEGWPDEYGDGSKLLSAGLTATLGLFDAYRTGGSAQARAAFERAVDWLVANVRRFDRDFVIQYAIGPLEAPADSRYLQLTITQLQVLAEASGRREIGPVVSDWAWRLYNPGAFKLHLMIATTWYQPLATLAAVSGIVGAVVLLRRH